MGCRPKTRKKWTFTGGCMASCVAAKAGTFKMLIEVWAFFVTYFANMNERREIGI